jgi:hypothetical protein
VERLYVVRVQLDLVASIRRLGPPSPELEWASTTLCELEDELPQELLFASPYQRAARRRGVGDRGRSPASDRRGWPGSGDLAEQTPRRKASTHVGARPGHAGLPQRHGHPAWRQRRYPGRHRPAWWGGGPGDTGPGGERPSALPGVHSAALVRIPVIANNDSGSKRTRFRSKPNRCRLAAPVVAVRLSSGPAGGQAT